MGKPQAPTPPDPQETAAAQTGTNVSTAIANNAMGMVGQSTPYGDLSYNQTGDYTWTDPSSGATYSVPQYSAVTSLTPQGQAIQDSNMAAQGNLADIAANQSGFLKDYLGQGIDSQAVDDRLYELGTQRLDPRFAQQEDSLRTRLANQGLTQGSEAFNREMANFEQSRNDAYNQLALTGRGQSLSEALALRNQPINEITALMSGSQVQAPNFQIAQPGGMATTDYAGLVNNNYNQQYQSYANQMAQQQSLLGGFLGLGGNLAMAFSDERLKTDIEFVGISGNLPVFEYRYVWDDPETRRKGFIAQHVAAVYPEAVSQIGGFMAVDYRLLPEV